MEGTSRPDAAPTARSAELSAEGNDDDYDEEQ